ncbi:four helix bundle protein [Ferrimonas senticii]|uniref:four helix bundle protein n=1 Tax=Ferrimonas senticii TaxID=394566 RepID=UPI000404320F|nr:four helix bundle protein [Ferrimonas senticii]
MELEKLEIWQRACRLSCELYQETNQLRDFGFRDQLTRSGLSVPSNIAEGMARQSAKEKVRFLDIARASLAEARTQIYIGKQVGFLNPKRAESWIDECRQLASMISALMIAVERNC